MTIPNGWKRVTLGELGVEAQPGFASGRHNSEGVGVIHLRPMNITRRGELDFRDVRYVEDESSRRVRAGDVLFNNTNSPELVGKTALVTSAEPLAYSNHMTRLKVPGVLRADFLADQLYWLWASGYFKTVLNNHVNQASVARKQLLATPIVLPSLAEQQGISARLENFLSRIDSLVDRVSALNDKVADLVSRSIDLAARGPLGDGSSDWNSARLLVGLTSSKFNYSTLGSLPENWVWRTAAEMCRAIVCGSTPESNLMTSGRGDIPFLKVYNIAQSGRVDFNIRPTFVSRETHNGKLARSRVFPGDVLTNIVGPPLGKTAVVPDTYPEWNINQAIVAFRTGPKLCNDWLALLLRSPFIIDKLKSTARATAGQFNISLSACRQLPIPVPPLQDQLDIIRHVTNVVEVAEFGSRSVSSIVSNAEELRMTTLSQAFKGEL